MKNLYMNTARVNLLTGSAITLMSVYRSKEHDYLGGKIVFSEYFQVLLGRLKFSILYIRYDDCCMYSLYVVHGDR